MSGVDLPFPFNRAVRTGGLGLVIIGCGLAALGIARGVGGTEGRAMMEPILLAVALIGVAIMLLGLGTPGPSLRHFQKTGKYLIPGRGGAIETSWGWLMWLSAVVFAGLGACLAGMGLYGLARL